MSLRVKFAIILLLTAVCAFLVYPKEGEVLQKLGLKNANLQVKQGLDLQGGAYLVFQADPEEFNKKSQQDREQAMTSLIGVIERRANPAGTSEISVQKQGADRVIVQLPGVQDVDEAVQRIGRTAELIFLEVAGGSATEGTQTLDTGIGGQDVERATVDFDPQSGQPIVRLQMKGGSIKKFGDLTTKINRENGQLVTLLDDQIVFGPATVSSPITDGIAQLQGNFTSAEEAREVADQINAGALPIPVSLVEQRSIGPSLGKESVQRSLVAGIIGLGVVALFMLVYYRGAGLLAVAALAVYTLISIALYKLSGVSPTPIVLTLAGTAGFILSIGMAVDANILIFERLKEELRAGKSFAAALEAGFDRAWTSIRDSNVATLITCFILYFFTGTAIIKGFAVTLALGVLISMFTSIVISRTFLRLVIRYGWGRRPGFYGLKDSEVAHS